MASIIKKLSDDVIRKLLDNNENFKCSFFVPFESDHSRPNSNNNPFKLPKIFRNNNNTINTKGKPFSDFSPLLEQVIELSEEIVKSCQSAENKKILEQFESRVSEAIKAVTDLKNYKNQYNYFFNQDNYALLEKLYNNTKNIENLEEISKSKILLIPKIKELSKVRKVKKSFDNDLVKIQTFMKSSKGHKYGNMTTTMTEITTGEDGKTVTTVRTNLDSNSKTMYNATFISEPEEILITDLQDDKMDKKDKMKEIDETGDSGTIKEKTITFISSETDDYGDVKITSKIKISEDGKTTTAVTTTKKVSKLTKNVSKIDEIKEVSNNNESTTILQGDLKTTENQKRILYCSCTDKDGNITTIKTEITTGKDGKPEITVKTITIDSNGEEIYVANFVSSNIFDCNSEIEIVIDIDDKIDVDVDKIDEDVDKIDVEIDKNIDDKTEKEINNKGKEILKIVHFSGIPMKNQTKIFSYIEIDKDENETIIITEIKIDENENIITTVTITKKDLSSSNNYYNNDQ
ncbi:18882_t:CDS:2 [Rhizophagus irregularis]|nr:18882_t:CDS:2 [Rhizophagus irregularis]